MGRFISSGTEYNAYYAEYTHFAKHFDSSVSFKHFLEALEEPKSSNSVLLTEYFWIRPILLRFIFWDNPETGEKEKLGDRINVGDNFWKLDPRLNKGRKR